MPRGLGLSGKLLALTILFVMIAEVLIYVPSIANFRLNWLQRPALRRLYRGARARGRAERHGARKRGAPDPRQHRRARRRHEDGPAAPAARGLRTCRPRSITTSTCATCPGTAPSSMPSTRCSVDRQRRDARGRAGADGRRIHRDHHGRGAAAQSDAGLFGQHPAAVAARSPASPRRWSISRCIICSCGRCGG